MIYNSITVDLESFVHREFNLIMRKKKDFDFTQQVTNYLLDLFDSYHIKTTFFVVSEIYDWYPHLIEKIASQGHEIAYHSHRHIIIKNENILLEELQLSKKFISKYNPIGFRAPRLYVKEPYLKILSDYGFRYDSSTYGMTIKKIPDTQMKEIPVSFLNYFPTHKKIIFPQNMSYKLLFHGVPFGSGLFIGLLQKNIQLFINKINKEGHPAILFVHPWQFLDYEKDSFLYNLTHIPKLIYRKRINKSFEYILSRNKFRPMREFV